MDGAGGGGGIPGGISVNTQGPTHASCWSQPSHSGSFFRPFAHRRLYPRVLLLRHCSGEAKTGSASASGVRGVFSGTPQPIGWCLSIRSSRRRPRQRLFLVVDEPPIFLSSSLLFSFFGDGVAFPNRHPGSFGRCSAFAIRCQFKTVCLFGFML